MHKKIQIHKLHIWQVGLLLLRMEDVLVYWLKGKPTCFHTVTNDAILNTLYSLYAMVNQLYIQIVLTQVSPHQTLYTLQ